MRTSPGLPGLCLIPWPRKPWASFSSDGVGEGDVGGGREKFWSLVSALSLIPFQGHGHTEGHPVLHPTFRDARLGVAFEWAPEPCLARGCWREDSVLPQSGMFSGGCCRGDCKTLATLPHAVSLSPLRCLVRAEGRELPGATNNAGASITPVSQVRQASWGEGKGCNRGCTY